MLTPGIPSPRSSKNINMDVLKENMSRALFRLYHPRHIHSNLLRLVLPRNNIFLRPRCTRRHGRRNRLSRFPCPSTPLCPTPRKSNPSSQRYIIGIPGCRWQTLGSQTSPLERSPRENWMDLSISHRLVGKGRGSMESRNRDDGAADRVTRCYFPQ